jgi:hypothetical protein
MTNDSDDQDDNQNSNLPETKSTSKDDDGKDSSAIEPEVLKTLPPELRKVMEFFSISGPSYHPVTKKITEDHIDKILDQSDKDSDRGFRDAQASRRYGFVIFFVICILFVFLTVYLTSVDKDLYRDALKFLAGLLGGFGGGLAVKGYLDRDRN